MPERIVDRTVTTDPALDPSPVVVRGGPRAETRVVEADNPAARAVQVVYLVFGIIEGLIGIRIVLKLMAANPDAGFAQFIYNVTAPFLAPFQGLVGQPSANGSQLELSSIVAIIVYALLAYVIARIVMIAMRRNVSVSSRDVV